MNQIAKEWFDYELIDCGNKEKLERWNDIILRRPDPQALWPIQKNIKLWNNPHAHYHRSNNGGGSWEFKKHVQEFWTINYKHLKFKVSPTGFKHTGIFPEQASNWDFMMNLIKNENREIRVLNLFAYTGCATMACSSAGAKVVHVDASKGMVNWAKENRDLNNLQNNEIRFIVDDVIKFVAREKRRGNTYHGILMDPPSYGRGPNKEVWKIEEQIFELITKCLDILDNDPLFFLVNCYTTGFSPLVLNNLLSNTVLKKHPEGVIETGENTLPISSNQNLLPCGIYGKWYKK